MRPRKGGNPEKGATQKRGQPRQERGPKKKNGAQVQKGPHARSPERYAPSASVPAHLPFTEYCIPDSSEDIPSQRDRSFWPLRPLPRTTRMYPPEGIHRQQGALCMFPCEEHAAHCCQAFYTHNIASNTLGTVHCHSAYTFPKYSQPYMRICCPQKKGLYIHWSLRTFLVVWS